LKNTIESLFLAFKGVRVNVHPSLPCQKDVALSIPKKEGAKREFWHSELGEVFGFVETLGGSAEIYLSKKCFNAINKNLRHQPKDE
jgi:hypothetical protein